ncbi:hypothetical protein [Ligaoa zhengdingensis]|uniref:hypothetical protein n=1 Tax=Ligaoa zhengdingensis TaxID=2763658 RepID=UPI0031BBB941
MDRNSIYSFYKILTSWQSAHRREHGAFQGNFTGVVFCFLAVGPAGKDAHLPVFQAATPLPVRPPLGIYLCHSASAGTEVFYSVFLPIPLWEKSPKRPEPLGRGLFSFCPGQKPLDLVVSRKIDAKNCAFIN